MIAAQSDLYPIIWQQKAVPDFSSPQQFISIPDVIISGTVGSVWSQVGWGTVLKKRPSSPSANSALISYDIWRKVDFTSFVLLPSLEHLLFYSPSCCFLPRPPPQYASPWAISPPYAFPWAAISLPVSPLGRGQARPFAPGSCFGWGRLSHLPTNALGLSAASQLLPTAGAAGAGFSAVSRLLPTAGLGLG